MSFIFCINCGASREPHRTETCYKCRYGFDVDGTPLSPIVYCSLRCKQEYKPKHDLPCKMAIDRKQIFRAGELLQAIAYAIWKNSSMLHYESVQYNESEDRLSIRATLPNGNGDPFVPFPTELFHDANHEHAAMSFHVGGTILEELRPIVDKCLKGIKARITHRQFSTRVSRTMLEFPSNPDFESLRPRHDSLQLRLEDDSRFTLTLTGAQFRSYQPVMKSSDFIDPGWISKQQQWANLKVPCLCSPERQWALKFTARLAQYVADEVTEWEENSEVSGGVDSISKLLRGQEKGYVDGKEQILELVEERVKRLCKRWWLDGTLKEMGFKVGPGGEQT